MEKLRCKICQGQVSPKKRLCHSCYTGLSAFDNYLPNLKRAILYLKRDRGYGPGDSPIIHGVDCPKSEHFPADVGEYLHDEKDDTFYSVDGVDYYGRCHVVIE